MISLLDPFGQLLPQGFALRTGHAAAPWPGSQRTSSVSARPPRMSQRQMSILIAIRTAQVRPMDAIDVIVVTDDDEQQQLTRLSSCGSGGRSDVRADRLGPRRSCDHRTPRQSPCDRRRRRRRRSTTKPAPSADRSSGSCRSPASSVHAMSGCWPNGPSWRCSRWRTAPTVPRWTPPSPPTSRRRTRPLTWSSTIPERTNCCWRGSSPAPPSESTPPP